jgi:voltage-gated potassium channel
VLQGPTIRRSPVGVAARPRRGTRAEVDSRSRLHGLRLGLIAIVVLVAGGTAGYVVVEGWSLGEALYMVVITLSTVGFHEVRPLGPAGRILTSVLIVVGVAAFAYVASAIVRLSVEGELRRVVGRRRMVREIAKLDNHYIVCGYGRVGREVCRNLRADGVSLIVIDRDEKALAPLRDSSVPHLRGNAVEEEVLSSAGIERARGLLLTLSDEADNVYVTLLARDLRPDLLVIARSVSEQGERRLVAAGANRVVSPERIGARSMSNSVTRPSTVEFTEIVTARENLELQLEEIRLSPGSELADKSIEECNIRRNFGVIVVAILAADGEMLFNPAPGQRLEAGSTLVVLGRREDLGRFAAAS